MDAAAKSESNVLHSSLRYKIIALVGNENVHAATAADAIAGVLPKLVIEPGTETEFAEVLRLANEAGLSVIPRGGGTKLKWGNPPTRADLVLSTARLTEIIEHAWADLTVSVEAGCTIQRLQEALGEHRQRLALDTLWPERATIGGVLATNDSGALRLRFGALRDLIIGITVALPDGTLASSGGRVVKNVAGYDLPKLMTGAFGTLGIITRAVFRLHPLPRNTRSFSVATATSEEAQRFVLSVQDSKLAHTFLQTHFSSDSPSASEILFEGTEAGLAAQETQLKKLAGEWKVSEAPASSWTAREQLWSAADLVTTAIAKITMLPADLERTMNGVANAARLHQLAWRGLVYATGIGWVRLEGKPTLLRNALQLLRVEVEKHGGSLVVLQRPESLLDLDTWGNAGDALALMKSVKWRIDPRNALNPGRFVGGI